MIQTIWTYQVKEEKRAEFERRYSADGDWARLFAKANGYRGTTLLRDVRESGRYATLDCWEGLATMTAFKREFGHEYEALDKLCGELTESEEHVGIFEACSK